ncbi:unnamed protein product [Cladocopium goreaui]|uniref:Uncharacterized protein n=1 Tax=Cladocopium goreaui TaxID=2562237 RepID=A0A9P1GFR1_9DINO|nr:unnamed protein product [Cladocopium goreaui]
MTDVLLEEGGMCGSILRSMKIPCNDTGSVDWHYLHPCALLHAFSKRRPEFGDLLRNAETHRICVYMDEITPGNVLRPDHGKSGKLEAVLSDEKSITALWSLRGVFSKKYQQLPKKFFEERVNWEDNTVLKAFAGETLLVVDTLVLFNEIVLKPLGILQDHRESLELASDILGILSLGAAANQFQRELKRKIARHNELFEQLYSECAKPKFHWLFHVPENIERIGRSLACFNPERKHRCAKTVAAFVHNEFLQVNMAMRIGNECLQSFSDYKICQETFLEGQGKDASQWDDMLGQKLGKKVSVKVGDALMLTEDEIAENHCCTCSKPVDVENSLVIIRANVKGVEVRRCRSCHNVRSAINRMTKNHGTLVKDFFKVTGDRLEAFYKEHGHLRGEDLRSKVEEVVTDWKTQTTRFEFNQDAEYLDEDDIKKRYEHKPEDAIEHGTTEKRKGQMALKNDEPEPPQKKPKAKAKCKAKKEGTDESQGNEEPKMKAGDKKKLSKKLEAVITKAALLKEHLAKAATFGDMIPKYVLEAGQKGLADMEETNKKAEELLASGKGEPQPVIDGIEKHIEAVNEATLRIKAQMDSAAAFK